MATTLIATKGGSKITVEVNGAETQVSVNGIKGASCKDATAQLEKALGKVTSTKSTPEAYQSAGQQVRAR